jgi:hypothetical protein
MRKILAIALPLALCGCGGELGPPGPLQGNWSAPPFGDNSTVELGLRQVAGTVVGGGSYQTKMWIDTTQVPGPRYSLVVNGTDSAGMVVLIMQYRLGAGIASLGLRGALQDPEHLTGILDFGGDRREPVTFTRR